MKLAWTSGLRKGLKAAGFMVDEELEYSKK